MVTLDARPRVRVVGATLQVSDVESEAIITRLAGKGVLSGKASGDADLTSRGATLNQILDQLSGKLSVKVVKGTVIGYDVRNMLLNWLNKYVYKKTVHTPFDGLDAAFTIDKGLARTSGIELTGPSISIMAKGAARLSTRQIDYRSRLSVVPPPKGYGIPVRITGLWTGPKVRPDVWAWISGSSGLESVAAASALPELKDPELDALLKRALEKAGPGRALDPDAALPLKVLSGELELEKN
jgi:AsmA protein